MPREFVEKEEQKNSQHFSLSLCFFFGKSLGRELTKKKV